jgi:hypothetical protein
MTRLEMVFTPERAHLRRVRLLVDSVIAAGMMDRELAVRVAMTATELAENAVKYGVTPESFLRVEMDAGHSHIRIESENSATPSDIAEVQRLIAEVCEGDALDAYEAALIRSASDEFASKLGLARIRAEGKMELSCQIVGDRVRIIAACPVAQRAPAVATPPTQAPSPAV